MRSILLLDGAVTSIFLPPPLPDEVDYSICSSSWKSKDILQIRVSTKVQWYRNVENCYCGEPAISLHSYTVPLVQWSTHLLPVMRDPGLNPQGGTYVKPGFSC
jgi:hypothetical protein